MSRQKGYPPRPSSSSHPTPSPQYNDERYRQLNLDSDCDDISQEGSSHSEDENDDENDYFLDLDLDDDDDENENDSSYHIIPPPLPLCDFGPDESSNPLPKSINGCHIRTVTHLKNKNIQADKLYDPLLSRYYADWLTFRDSKERQLKEENILGNDFTSTIVYKDVPFLNRDIESRESRNESDDTRSESIDKLTDAVTNLLDSCKFDAEFESGNLESVSRIYGRESFVQPKSTTTTIINSTKDTKLPSEMSVDQEYDITLRNDLHTTGNIQWYYFMMTSPPATISSTTTTTTTQTTSASTTTSDSSIQYPLRIRLNIINMMKSDALYNYGMKPVVYSEYSATHDHIGWRHWNTEQICYYRNNNSYSHKKKKKKIKKRYYTLSFVYTFQREDTVYFAHSIPYTYTQLQQYLYDLELKYSNFNSIFKRKLLCHTLCNNRCDLLTITSLSPPPPPSSFSSSSSTSSTAAAASASASSTMNLSSQRSSLSPSSSASLFSKSIILITARIHPGETNSSHVMEHMISYLLSDEQEAIQLRNHYIFKIIPMLNPDGVIHGNYRCSLAGVDLNRKYLDPDSYGLYPVITSLKALIQQLKSSRGISLYLDIHGHSQKKNVFFYGCDLTRTNQKDILQGVQNLSLYQYVDRSIFPRIFPKVVSRVSMNRSRSSGYFSLSDSSFKVQKAKSGTGRVVCWNQLGILPSYTIEISFCSNGNNEEVNYMKLLTNYERKKQREGRVGLVSSSSPSPVTAAAVATSLPSPANITAVNTDTTSTPRVAGESTGGGGGGENDVNNIIPPESYLKYFEDGYLQKEFLLSSSNSNSNANANEPLSSFQKKLYKSISELKQIIKSYEFINHYTEHDYKLIAQDILTGICCYSNLQTMDHSLLSNSLFTKMSHSHSQGQIQGQNQNKIQNLGGLNGGNRSTKFQSSPLLPSQVSSLRPSSASSNRVPSPLPSSSSPSFSSPITSSLLPLRSPILDDNSSLPDALLSSSSLSPSPSLSPSLSPSPSSLFQMKTLTKNQLRIKEIQSQDLNNKSNLPNWELFEIKSCFELSQPIVTPSMITRDVLSQLRPRIQQLSRKSYEELILPNYRLRVELELRDTIQIKYSKNDQNMIPIKGEINLENLTMSLNEVKNIKITYPCSSSIWSHLNNDEEEEGYGSYRSSLANGQSNGKNSDMTEKEINKEEEEGGRAGTGEGGGAAEEEEEEEEEDDDDCGSDSDPSGDELPSKNLLHNKSFLTFIKGSQPNIIKNIKSVIKNKKKRKKKKSDEFQKSSHLNTHLSDHHSHQDHQKNHSSSSTNSSSSYSSSRRNTAPHRQAISLAHTFSTSNGLVSSSSSPIISLRKSSLSQQKKSLRIKTFSIDSNVNHKPDTTEYPRRQSNLTYQIYSSDQLGGGDDVKRGLSNQRRQLNSDVTMSMNPTAVSSSSSSTSLSSDQVMENKKLRSHIPLTVKDITLGRDFSGQNKLSQISTSPISVNNKPPTKEILTSCPHLKSTLTTRSQSKPPSR